jgi:hypothetical protein
MKAPFDTEPKASVVRHLNFRPSKVWDRAVLASVPVPNEWDIYSRGSQRIGVAVLSESGDVYAVYACNGRALGNAKTRKDAKLLAHANACACGEYYNSFDA